MLQRTNALNSLLAITLLLCQFLASDSALAQSSCLSASERAQKIYIDEFRRDPARYAADLGNNTNKIAGLISSFVASDPNLLDVLRRLIAQTNAEQRYGIGMGLAGAAGRCASSQPSVSGEISRYGRSVTDRSLLAGFQSRQAPTQFAPSRRKAAETAGAGLIQGEFADKLADPFAEITVPSP